MSKKPAIGSILMMTSLAFGLAGCAPVGTPRSLHETPQTTATEVPSTLEPTAPRPSETPEPMETAPHATLQPTEPRPGQPPPPSESRQIADNHLNLREYWRVSARSYGRHEDATVRVVSGWVVYEEGDSSGMLLRLRVLNAASGSLSWEMPWHWKNRGPLAVDTERVYYEVDFKLRAYSLAEGILLWETKDLDLLPFRIYWMYSDGETLCARGWPDLEGHYFDVHTGEEVGYKSFAAGDGFVVEQFPSFVLYTSPWTLQALDPTTQQVLWKIDTGIPGYLLRRPELFNDTLLVGDWMPVFAIDVQTGQIKWHNRDRPFASNWIAVNDSIYALDYNARLIQLDIETGQETGYIQFTPASTDVSTKGYAVAADGEMFFVYFGDSQELIALGP